MLIRLALVENGWFEAKRAEPFGSTLVVACFERPS